MSASFFSFFEEVFTEAIPEVRVLNSQNMTLLSASLAPHVAWASSTEDVMTVGDHALLADAGPIGALPDADHHMEAEGQISIYVVRTGDSLGSIATMFGVSVNTILWANDMDRQTKITPGTTLVILPVSGVRYVVKKNDTIQSIAKKFKGDEEEIRSYNGLDVDTVLAVGAEIIIPDGEIAPPPAPKRSVTTTTSRLRGASGPALEGYYRAPMSNYRRSQGLHGYNGVDLVSYDGPGAFVMAAASGEVIISKQGCVSRGCNGGYGNYVVIRHPNGTQTLYAHLKSNAVSQGASVAQGQLIGYMGNTGRSTGHHLHFEIRGARNPF